MFDFDKLDREDLVEGPTQASTEGTRSIFDHRWVWMAIIVLVIGALLQNVALLALTAFMLCIVAFSWLWNRYVTGGLSYQRTFSYRRVFPGEDIEAQITVVNDKLLPVTWVQFEDEWPTAFGPADESLLAPSAGAGMGYLVNVYALRWYERVKRRYLLTARARGIWAVGPTHLISGDPFGLFENGTKIEKPDVLIIYPVIKPLAELGMIAKDPFGDLGSPQRLFEDPSRMIGVRDYRSGDGFRSVHWKMTARTGALQVKQFEPTRSMSLILSLNIASFEQHWRGIWPEIVEHLLCVAASLVSWGLESGYAVGVSANATLAQADRSVLSQPSRNRDQLTHLLEMLAGVSYFITQDYANFLLAESPRLPWGATLVLLTGYVNESILASIWQLRESGRRIVLIVVGKTPPPDLPGVLTYHLPVPDAEPPAPKAPADPEKPTANDAETPRQRYLRQRAERDKAAANVAS